MISGYSVTVSYLKEPEHFVLRRFKRIYPIYLAFLRFLLYTAGRTLFHWPYFSEVTYGGNLLLLSFVWICGLRLARNRDNAGPVLWDIRLIFAGHLALGAAIQLMSRIKHHSAGRFLIEDVPPMIFQAATLWCVYFVFSRYILRPREVRRRSEVLRFLGDVSYPLYLIHLAIYNLVALTAWKVAGVHYLAALVAAGALYWLVDGYSKRRHLKIAMA